MKLFYFEEFDKIMQVEQKRGYVLVKFEEGGMVAYVNDYFDVMKEVGVVVELQRRAG